MKALALDPNHGEALSFYSGVLLGVGRVKDAVAMKQRLNQLEPYVPLYAGNLGEALWIDGQIDAAIAVLKENVGRQGAGAAIGLSRIYASRGQYVEAADALGSVVPTSEDGALLASQAAGVLRSVATKTISPENLPRFPIPGSYVYFHAGAYDRALEPYEEGFSTGSDVGLLWQPTYAPMRRTERFKKVVRDLGLVAYWRAKGWPEFCKPVGADDFVCE